VRLQELFAAKGKGGGRHARAKASKGGPAASMTGVDSAV
jgi:hypothetical protein